MSNEIPFDKDGKFTIKATGDEHRKSLAIMLYQFADELACGCTHISGGAFVTFNAEAGTMTLESNLVIRPDANTKG